MTSQRCITQGFNAGNHHRKEWLSTVLPLLNLDRHRVRHDFLFACDRSREAFDGGGSKHDGQRNSAPGNLSYLGEQKCCLEGVTAQLEKVVCYAHGRGSQNFLKQRQKGRFKLVAGRNDLSACIALRLRQTTSVNFPACCQRQFIKHHEACWHHKFRELFG